MEKTKEENLAIAQKLAEEVAALNGRAFYVGGYVRDCLLGVYNKDMDVEIHGITIEQLEKILNRLGKQKRFGESFGIYKLLHYDLDIALPRKERVTGAGHRDFAVTVDPFIGTYQAAMRRDFTMNALMQDILTGEILDYFDGVQDLRKGIIRHVNDVSFKEDPLRVLRAAQFAARFSFSICEETKEACRTIPLNALSKERVMTETDKALCNAKQPSVYFQSLNEMHQLDEWFLEVKQLIGVPQSARYHKEGDVFTRTMMVVDEAATFLKQVHQPKAFMYAALVHDFGKPGTTTLEADGRIRSIGHEMAGLSVVKTFMHRLTNEKELVGYCLNMTKLHMLPNQHVRNNSSAKAFNHLFDSSVDPLDLIYLATADNRGRIAETKMDNLDVLLEKYKKYASLMAQPYVSGDDLIKMGYLPNAHFKEILAYAHKLRLAGVPYLQQKQQVQSYANKVLEKRKTVCD